MNDSRRGFLKQASLSSGAFLLTPILNRLAAEAAGETDALPQRFVFVVKSSGIIPSTLEPRFAERTAHGSQQVREPVVGVSQAAFNISAVGTLQGPVVHLAGYFRQDVQRRSL